MENLTTGGTNYPSVAPVDVGDVDISAWTGDPLPLKLAELWVRYSPKGKGAFPRLVGRTFGTSNNWMTTRHGARLAMARASMDTYAAILNGNWNEHVLTTCARFMAKGGVFYDLGANVGHMSIEMAQMFAGEVTVIAVEPQPDLSRAVALSARLNNFTGVRVYEVMLGEAEGKGQLFLIAHQVHASAVPRQKRSRVIECRVTTIDQMVLRREIPPPTVIKMDMEGAELSALRGAVETLRSHRPAIVFECDENAGRWGYTLKDLTDYIAGTGPYEFFSIATNGALIPLGGANTSGARLSDDVLARPAGSRD